MMTSEEVEPLAEPLVDYREVKPGGDMAKALAAFQAQCPSIKKGNTAKVQTRGGGEYKYSYADLTDVTEAAYPLLAKHGLAFSTLPTLTPNNGFVLQYRLMHTSGEFLEGMYPLPDPSGQDADGRAITPQQLGSAITYARRYSLCAVTGIAPGGDDDDAEIAQTTTRARPTPKQKPIPKAVPTRPWKQAIDDVGTYQELYELHEAAEQLGELGLGLPEIDGVTVSGYMEQKRELLAPAVLQPTELEGVDDKFKGVTWETAEVPE